MTAPLYNVQYRPKSDSTAFKTATIMHNMAPSLSGPTVKHKGALRLLEAAPRLLPGESKRKLRSKAQSADLTSGRRAKRIALALYDGEARWLEGRVPFEGKPQCLHVVLLKHCALPDKCYYRFHVLVTCLNTIWLANRKQDLFSCLAGLVLLRSNKLSVQT